jgi:hypothetical protein
VAQRTSARKTATNRRSTSKAPARSAKTVSRSSTARASSSKKERSSPSSGKGNAREIPAGDREVTIDRRRGDAKLPADLKAPVAQSLAAPKLERRQKVNRRRQIDPTTCERDYTDDEVEFMNAIDDYKRKSGRMFPTCSEVLEVLRGIGYQKVSAAQAAMTEAAPAANSVAGTADWTLETAADMTL